MLTHEMSTYNVELTRSFALGSCQVIKSPYSVYNMYTVMYNEKLFIFGEFSKSYECD